MTYLRQYVNSFVAASERQVEHGAAFVGHRRRLQLQHKIGAVGLAHRRLGVLLGTDHVEGLRVSGRGRRSVVGFFTLVNRGCDYGRHIRKEAK